MKLSSFPYFGNATLDFPKGRNKERRFMEWKDGGTPYEITVEMMRDSDDLARERRPKIKAAMEHAWKGYKKYAPYGEDEVFPISGFDHAKAKTKVGTTLIDSLDTMWIMDMKKEFWEARDWVRDSLNQNVDEDKSVFETTIRNLGGLMSSYDLSGDTVFLEKAIELGDKLILAYNTKSGAPLAEVNLLSNAIKNQPWSRRHTSLADCALQIEFRNLSKISGNSTYAEKSEYVIKALERLTPPNGIHSAEVDNLSEEVRLIETSAASKMTFGGQADSFFEYLLKTWIQGGKKESFYREMYDKAIQGLHNELIYKSSPSGLLFLHEKISGEVNVNIMDHLACFAGGKFNIQFERLSSECTSSNLHFTTRDAIFGGIY